MSRRSRGWVYVAFVMDVFSRCVVGWQTSTSLRSDLAIDALEMAIYARSDRNLDGLVHHSDRGVQYLAVRYTERLAEVGVVNSVGSRGDAGTTRSPKASSPPSTASSSTPAPGPLEPDFDAVSSNTSKAGTTRAGCTRRSATSVLPNTKLSTTTPTVRRHNQHKQPVRRTGSSPIRCLKRYVAREVFAQLPRSELTLDSP